MFQVEQNNMIYLLPLKSASNAVKRNICKLFFFFFHFLVHFDVHVGPTQMWFQSLHSSSSWNG